MEDKKFLTIRQTAALGILPEHTLRRMQKTGALPGFFTGNRFLVNVHLLMEELDRISSENWDGKDKITL